MSGVDENQLFAAFKFDELKTIRTSIDAKDEKRVASLDGLLARAEVVISRHVPLHCVLQCALVFAE